MRNAGLDETQAGIEIAGRNINNLRHADQEGTTDWFKLWKGVRQGCVLSPCLFNFYAKYIMRNARLNEAQAGVKIAGRNINSFR